MHHVFYLNKLAQKVVRCSKGQFRRNTWGGGVGDFWGGDPDLPIHQGGGGHLYFANLLRGWGAQILPNTNYKKIKGFE